jgi:hypothetical protein
MVTQCSHCGQKVRVNNPGKYRCPSCNKIFEHSDSSASSEDSIVIEDGDNIYVDVHGYPPPQQNDSDDLYIDSEEAATACETCRRPGATDVCKECGNFVCTTCKLVEDDQTYCPSCADKLARHQAMGYDSESTGINTPGFVDSFVSRLKAVLLEPARFFQTPIPNEAPSHPILFAMVCYCIGGVFSLAYQLVFQRAILNMGDSLTGLADSRSFDFLSMFSTGSMDPGQVFLTSSFLMPGMAFVALFLVSGIVHLFLRIFSTPHGRFIGTLRVVAYSNVTHLFLLIPILGGLVSFVWQVVIVIIGTSQTHRISGGRATLAVLLPFALIFLVAVLLVTLVMIFVPTFFENLVG